MLTCPYNRRCRLDSDLPGRPLATLPPGATTDLHVLRGFSRPKPATAVRSLQLRTVGPGAAAHTPSTNSPGTVVDPRGPGQRQQMCALCSHQMTSPRLRAFIGRSDRIIKVPPAPKAEDMTILSDEG
jgi:hypothetical protein